MRTVASAPSTPTASPGSPPSPTCSRGRASKQPLAIVLDDAHLADAAATLLTRFVVRTLHQTPLLVVVTRRTGGDGPGETRRTLDELERDATVIALEGFDDETTASMLCRPRAAASRATAWRRRSPGSPAATRCC